MFTLMRRKTMLQRLLVLVGLSCLSFSIFAQDGDQALSSVDFRLDWKAAGQHAPFFLGKARGFYADEGIDLNIITGSGSSDTIKQVGVGAIEFGLVDALVLVQAAEQQIPVKSIAPYYQRTPIVLISPKSKPITSPKQLNGSVKIGAKRGSATQLGLMALLAVNHIDPKTLNMIDIGYGVQPLLVGQVDTLMGFSMNEPIEAEGAGMPVNAMPIAEHGVMAYGLTLVANSKELSQHPELAEKFMRATRRSVQAAVDDPDAAIQTLVQASSEMDAARERLALERTVPFLYTTEGNRDSFGTQTLAGWQQTTDTAKRVGLIETTVDPADVFYQGN